MPGREPKADEPVTARAELARAIRSMRGGMSQHDLGKRTGYTRQYMTWAESETGQLPSQEVVSAIDRELNAGGRLVELRARALAERNELRGRGTRSRQRANDHVQVDHPLAGLIDVLGPSQAVHAVEAYTKGVIARYELEGPQRLVPEVLHLRQFVHQLAKRVSADAEKTTLTRLGAHQSALLAYMAVNLSKFARAEEFALEAAVLATALDDNALLAWVKGTQSFAAYYRKQYREALLLAEVGVTIAGSDPQRIRLLSNGVARAAGKLGDRRTVERAVGEALDLASQTNSAGMTACIDLEPYDWSRTAANAATAYLAVGDHTKMLELTKELKPLVARSGSDWSRSLVNLDEATALTMEPGADLDHAAAVGVEALETSAAKPIASVGLRAKELAASLHHRGGRQVSASFLDAINEWQKQPSEGV